ncbi:MAG: hypothetical protein IT223_01710 [Crocinitomicaceae bacterium]|nr:hypothetical protein [Crocinitomicaceae bacterium]
MKKMKELTYLFLPVIFAFSFLLSCKKEEDLPVVPQITYRSISSTNIQSFNNEIEIGFSYEDFQGDLGNSDPDIFSLRIKDDRLSDYDWYHIPPMAPGTTPLHIKGTYSIVLKPLFLMGNGGNEATRFTLQIKDRAGNWSNQITTPVVTIHE